MLPSLPPLSSTAAVGLQVSAYTIALGSLQACRRCPLDTSQTKSSPLPPLPLPPRTLPSLLHATPPTSHPSPRSLPAGHLPAPSHMVSTRPQPALANCAPSGLQATSYSDTA